MKIIKSTPRPNGRTRLTVELEPSEGIRAVNQAQNFDTCAAHERLVTIDPDAHYKLGEPMREDVIAGHILADATRVHWCSIEQKWVD